MLRTVKRMADIEIIAKRVYCCGNPKDQTMGTVPAKEEEVQRKMDEEEEEALMVKLDIRCKELEDAPRELERKAAAGE